MSRCKSCGAEIRWVKMTTGAKMPLDAKPVRNLVVLHTDLLGDPAGSLISEAFVSHFATCPDADEHRKGKDNS